MGLRLRWLEEADGALAAVVQVGDVLMVCPRDRAQDVRALTVALEQLGETRLL